MLIQIPIISFIFCFCYPVFLPLLLLLPLPLVQISCESFQLDGWQYEISLQRENPFPGSPLLSHWNSDNSSSSSSSHWLYNYNVALVPFVPASLLSSFYPSIDFSHYFPLGAAFRLQNLTSNATSIYEVGPSQISYTVGICLKDDVFACDFNVEMLNSPDFLLVASKSSNWSILGAEDPRVVMVNNSLLLFYTSVFREGEGDGRVQASLSLSTCSNIYYYSDPSVPWQEFLSCFSSLGPIIPTRYWSKSGGFFNFPFSNESKLYLLNYLKQAGILFDSSSESFKYLNLDSFDIPIYFLFYGDSSIHAAVTTDFIHFTNLNLLDSASQDDDRFILFSPRPFKWDNSLVESGPEPLKLSNAKILYLYNSGGVRDDLKNPKPNWNILYNLGFVILNEKNPLIIEYRSENPLFSPQESWELCDDNNGGEWKSRCLTPLVVFIEGWKYVGSLQLEEGGFIDEFLVFYQGGDTSMGIAKLTVKMKAIRGS